MAIPLAFRYPGPASRMAGPMGALLSAIGPHGHLLAACASHVHAAFGHATLLYIIAIMAFVLIAISCLRQSEF